MFPLKIKHSTLIIKSFFQNESIGRIAIYFILLASLGALISACSSGPTNTPTVLPAELATRNTQTLMLNGTVVPGTNVSSIQQPKTTATIGAINIPTTQAAELATQHALTLLLNGTVMPGTSVPIPQPLKTAATFVVNLQGGLLDSKGDITACIDPNIDYLIERMGAFDPKKMSEIIQAATFQDADGSTKTAMEKLKVVVGSYDVDLTQFVFLYIPRNIAILPNYLANEEIGKCLGLIYIPDPTVLIPLFSGL
jgi:hypothetical protein